MMRTRKTTTDTLAAFALSLVILFGALPRPAGAHAKGKKAEVGGAPARTDAPRAHARNGRVEKSLARLPAWFEANAGQADARVKFLSRGVGHTLLLRADGATLALRVGGERMDGAAPARRLRSQVDRGRERRELAPPTRLLHMKFVGANPRPRMEGAGELKGKVNYFVGNDPKKWRAGVPTFAGVRYRDLYPGVDAVYHNGGGGRLEYDFVVAPGADYRPVRLRFDGADSLSVDASGDLLVHTKGGTLRQGRPVVYQEVGGARREVAGRYVLRGAREVGFAVGDYDARATLVIDPVLVYSTYFLPAYSMAVDASGNVYVTGAAEGVEPPTTPGAFQTVRRGVGDAFVAKLDAGGAELSYLTYLGGGAGDTGGGEYGEDVAVDASGNAYVTGLTYSTDFPVVNAFQPAYGGGGADGFVSKLNATGSALLYSSYVGGGATEWGQSIAVDAAGGAYVYGDTDSADFPLKNALQATKKGSTDFFALKVAPGGGSLEYSTYLGGGESETGYLGDIAIDAAGSLYVAGTSYSSDYPTTPGAFQTTPSPPNAVVSKLAPDGSAFVYSTFVGGTDSDFANSLAVDASGQAHVAGDTFSADFPTKNPLYPSAGGPYGNGFLAKLNASGTALVYSTYLGGTPPQCGSRGLFGIVICSGDSANGVATDASGNAYVTGYTISPNFPAPLNALQPSMGGHSDAYVIKLDPAGQALYSTYFGGSSFDGGADVHADAEGTLYLLGWTSSSDFPSVNPYRDKRSRELDQFLGSFLAKISVAEPHGLLARVRFDSPAYEVGEGGRGVSIGVTRAGNLTAAVEVDYATGDRFATERSDYTTARGTLRFEPGEASKTFEVFVTDDNTVEGDETLNLTLHNLRGDAVLEGPLSAVLTVRDDDERPTDANPIDGSEFFVRQHYLDFLNREADDAGLQFWTSLIESCGQDAACREAKRVQVSAAFFLSIEFQRTGFLVERLYRLAFGTHVNYESFTHDARRLGEGVVVGRGDWEQRLQSNRRAYAAEFVARTAFTERYPQSLTAAQYVDLLNARSGGSLSQTERDALVEGLGAGTETRASVLLKVADDEDFRLREFSAAFVLMQYLGYLRRDPGAWPDNGGGYNFWLAKLDRFGGDWRAAEMVRAFISSTEYRGRFNEPAKEANAGTPFALKFGERAVVLPDKLRVEIADIGFDSRCPRGAQCPTRGSITILMQAVKAGGETARFTLRIEGGAPRPHTANTPAEALGYKFTLLQFDPEPPYPARPFTYEALLLVEKL